MDNSSTISRTHMFQLCSYLWNSKRWLSYSLERFSLTAIVVFTSSFSLTREMILIDTGLSIELTRLKSIEKDLSSFKALDHFHLSMVQLVYSLLIQSGCFIFSPPAPTEENRFSTAISFGMFVPPLVSRL
jgi:hypothetical protein